MQEGKFYFCPLPFYWTVIGRFVRHINFMKMEMTDVIYFRRPGATFDVLVSKGLILSGDNKSLFHSFGKRLIEIRSDSNLTIPWEDDNGNPQKTPWVKE